MYVCVVDRIVFVCVSVCVCVRVHRVTGEKTTI